MKRFALLALYRVYLVFAVIFYPVAALLAAPWALLYTTRSEWIEAWNVLTPSMLREVMEEIRNPSI